MAKKSVAKRAKKGSKRLEDLPSGRKAPAVKGGKAGSGQQEYMVIKLKEGRIS